MKKLLGIVVLGFLFCVTSYADNKKNFKGAMLVCESLSKFLIVIINKDDKLIISNDGLREIEYKYYSTPIFGTGPVGSPLPGDIWGLDKNGNRIAINPYTFRATIKPEGTFNLKYYNCRKVNNENKLF